MVPERESDYVRVLDVHAGHHAGDARTRSVAAGVGVVDAVTGVADAGLLRAVGGGGVAVLVAKSAEVERAGGVV